MKRRDSQNVLDRREFLETAGVLALGLSAAALLTPKTAEANGTIDPDSKPFRGLFPVAQTPFTPDNKLDLECLTAEVKFCNLNRVPGLLWPLNASGWTNLTETERMDGAEAILAAAKGGKTAIVIGVQAPGGDIDTAIRLAKHAARHGADGLISLPPGAPDAKINEPAIWDYYKALGAATDLPLMIQSYGDMSVDLIVRLYEQIPTIKGVKDETTGTPIPRLPEFRRRTDHKFVVMAAHNCLQMIDELRLGFDGYVPIITYADLLQRTFELWNAGKQDEAFEMFGRVQAFQSIIGATQYLLTARGVFKETTIVRNASHIFGPYGVTPDEAQRRVIRNSMKAFLGPYLLA
ncbi:MAG: dihydrodipicolinate synthase family protein [Nitrososphaerota archaeon]|nr:dihydrodipicolinate synthase family protein [Nitrososphaerota archaeon]